MPTLALCVPASHGVCAHLTCVRSFHSLLLSLLPKQVQCCEKALMLCCLVAACLPVCRQHRQCVHGGPPGPPTHCLCLPGWLMRCGPGLCGSACRPCVVSGGSLRVQCNQRWWLERTRPAECRAVPHRGESGGHALPLTTGTCRCWSIVSTVHVRALPSLAQHT